VFLPLTYIHEEVGGRSFSCRNLGAVRQWRAQNFAVVLCRAVCWWCCGDAAEPTRTYSTVPPPTVNRSFSASFDLRHLSSTNVKLHALCLSASTEPRPTFCRNRSAPPPTQPLFLSPWKLTTYCTWRTSEWYARKSTHRGRKVTHMTLIVEVHHRLVNELACDHQRLLARANQMCQPRWETKKPCPPVDRAAYSPPAEAWVISLTGYDQDSILSSNSSGGPQAALLFGSVT